MMPNYFLQIQKRPATHIVVIKDESSDNKVLIVAVAAHSTCCEVHKEDY